MMLLQITINPTLPTLPAGWLVPTAWVVGVPAALFWMRKELTPKRVVSLFVSENTLSLRLLLAAVVVLFALNMQRAGRLSAEQVAANYNFAEILLGLGVAKIVAKAFAERPPDTTTTVNTKNVDAKVTAENVHMEQTPVGPVE